jgi:hypothetical protein
LASTFSLKPPEIRRKEIEKIEVQNLPNNEALTGQINRAGGVVFFSFHADIEKEEAETIQISLTPIKGKFRLFVSSNGKLPAPTQDYWNVVGESLSLRPGDKFYQKQATYVVGVQAIVDKGSKVPGEKFMFNVAYSFSSRHLLLRESVPHISEFTAQDVLKPRFLRIEIPSDAKSLTFIRSSLSTSIFIAAAFGDANPYPDRVKRDIAVWESQTGFHVSEEDIKKHCTFKDTLSHCVLFVSLTSTIPVQYSVAYFTNDKPLILHQGFPSMFPMLMREDTPLHYLYFVQDGVKTLNFEISGIFQPVEYFVKIFDKEDLNAVQFPKSTDQSSYNLTGTSGNDFTLQADKLIRKDNQMIAISIYPVNLSIKNSAFPFHFAGDGKIEISSNDQGPGTRKSYNRQRAEWRNQILQGAPHKEGQHNHFDRQHRRCDTGLRGKGSRPTAHLLLQPVPRAELRAAGIRDNAGDDATGTVHRRRLHCGGQRNALEQQIPDYLSGEGRGGGVVAGRRADHREHQVWGQDVHRVLQRRPQERTRR